MFRLNLSLPLSEGVDSTKCSWKIFRRKHYIVIDVYYVVKPIMVALVGSVLNMYRPFLLSLFPKYSRAITYIAVTLC